MSLFNFLNVFSECPYREKFNNSFSAIWSLLRTKGPPCPLNVGVPFPGALRVLRGRRALGAKKSRSEHKTEAGLFWPCPMMGRSTLWFRRPGSVNLPEVCRSRSSISSGSPEECRPPVRLRLLAHSKVRKRIVHPAIICGYHHGTRLEMS